MRGEVLLPPRYRDPERAAGGGMGDVYRASDATLGRTVAIKLLPDRYVADEEMLRRFRREALAAARLSGGPNTVTVYDVGEWQGRPFIVMEYLAGGSLQDLLHREGAQPPGRALAWLAQAAAALDHAHANGVVHRDVKPANLLLDRDGQVHVADFGIASAAGLASMTQTGTVLGTAGYLAPEQAEGKRRPPRPTATRSAWSPSSCSPAGGRSSVTRSPPRPPPTCTRRRPRPRHANPSSPRRSIRSLHGHSRRIRRGASQAVASWSTACKPPTTRPPQPPRSPQRRLCPPAGGARRDRCCLPCLRFSASQAGS